MRGAKTLSATSTHCSIRSLAWALAAIAAAIMVVALSSAPSAFADTTHQFLGQLELKGSFGPQPIGVDDDGNIIVWQEPEEVIAKYSPDGDPVDFSALGTNRIDGKGGKNCPTVKADCDRVPANGFGTAFLSPSTLTDTTEFRAAMDQSGGMTDGYIYVTAQSPPKAGTKFPFTTYEVFDSTGAYLGRIDDGQAFPIRTPGYPASYTTVGPDGAFYIGYERFPLIFGNSFKCHLDKYVPVDLNPAHSEFAGQLAFGAGYESNVLDNGCSDVVGVDEDFIYVRGGAGTAASTLWRKYHQSEFERRLRPFEFSTAIDFSPNQCRCSAGFGEDQSEHLFSAFAFGDGGLEENILIMAGGFYFMYLGVDPVSDDVYLFNPLTMHIEQWSRDNERIGPVFGGGNEIDPPAQVGSARVFAFDHSGGPTEGRIYLRGEGTNKVAVYGPPVPIPDIKNAEADPDHASVTIRADLGLAGGPQIDSCAIEYGTTRDLGTVIACDPVGPFTSDTELATEIGGLTTEADYYYRIKVGNSNGTNITKGFVAHPVAVLDVETGDTTDATTASVTLNGTLDRDDLDTEYRFEYGLSTEYRSSTPFVDIGNEAGPTAVPPTQIDKLQSGRRYHYRLVARNSLGTTYGDDRTFIAPGRPGINALRAIDVSASEATLEGVIDTANFDTTYQFEYGPTSEYGNVIPVSPKELLASNEPTQVSQQLIGLREGIIYHYRLLATNQWGESASEDATFSFGEASCPNAHLRQQTRGTYLPDCRAYELVSPGDLAPLSLLPGSVYASYRQNSPGNPLYPYERLPAFNASGLASGPARFAYLGTMGTLPGMDPLNVLMDRYVATRTSKGWITTYPGLKGNQTALAGMPECSISMHKCIHYDLGTREMQNPDDAGSTSPYVYDTSGEEIERWPTNVDEIVGGDRPFGYPIPVEMDDTPSPDFTHFVFSSIGEPNYVAGGRVLAPGSVYDNAVSAKSVVVASLLANGAHIPRDAGSSSEFMRIPAVSIDGSHILMSTVAQGDTTNLYMRVNGGISYEVSRGQGVRFIGMTDNGSHVVFSTDKQLTPDDTDSSIDLFLWKEHSDQLTRISQGNGAGDSDDCSASWISQCGVEPIVGELPEIDDEISLSSGSVYFASPEQLDASNPGAAGERNLYHYHEGVVKYVTTLEPGTEINRIQISPDGRYGAFLTEGRLTAYDNKGFKEVYRYSADSGFIQCVSCIPSGEPPTIPHVLPVLGDDPQAAEFDVMASHSGRFMSDDGRVIFTTSDALVERDTNELLDVYEYTEGRAQLISSGISQRDTYGGTGVLSLIRPGFLGAEAISRDGRDIYFSTTDTLVSQDKIGAFVKFYDARTNGGFGPEPEFEPCVAADECHGDGATPLDTPRIGTAGSLGSDGNVPRPQRKAARKKTRKAAKRRAQKRRARLRTARAGKERSRG